MTAKAYDAQYYETGCGSVPYQNREVWLKHFREVVRLAILPLNPRPASVYDVGCAFGYLVEALREAGIDAHGSDISPYAISQASPAIRDVVRVADVTDAPGRRFDLITCIEVLEHVEKATAEAAIANFCAHSDAVLFSSSPYDQTTESHVNVQAVHVWAERFAGHGFWRDLSADVSAAAPWAGLFRKRAQPTRWQDYEDALAALHAHTAALRKSYAEASRELFELGQRFVALDQTCGELRAERDRLLEVKEGYERGRVMRVLNALTRARKRLGGGSQA